MFSDKEKLKGNTSCILKALTGDECISVRQDRVYTCQLIPEA